MWPRSKTSDIESYIEMMDADGSGLISLNEMKTYFRDNCS